MLIQKFIQFACSKKEGQVLSSNHSYFKKTFKKLWLAGKKPTLHLLNL